MDPKLTKGHVTPFSVKSFCAKFETNEISCAAAAVTSSGFRDLEKTEKKIQNLKSNFDPNEVPCKP